MREPIRDRSRLEHILTAIDRVMEFVKNNSFDELSENDLVYYGIVKNIEIVGEAAYKLSQQFRDVHPETPWKIIMKMRHVLVHDYYQIEKDEIRFVIDDDLPPLCEQVTRYLSETDWEAWENTPQNEN